MRKATRISLALGTSAALLSLSALPASADEKDSSATIQVQGGSLSIVVNPALGLQELTPGQMATFVVPEVAVTDNRAGLVGWTAQVSLTDFTAETVPGARAITPAAATYTVAPDTLKHTGIIADLAATDVAWTGADEDRAAVAATRVEGNNAASWDASLSVDVPAAALAGEYTAVLTHSVI